MKFKIPFTFSSLDKLKKRSRPFAKKLHHKKDSKLQKTLDNCNIRLTREEYLGIVMRSAVSISVPFFVISTSILFVIGANLFILLGLIATLLFTGFTIFSQLLYPKVYSGRRERDIEKNLIPALEDILVQLQSGIPLFNILVNISASDYGELSIEFQKAVKRINAGYPQIEVIEELGERSSSIYFKRTLWQLSNSLRAGSDISIVVRDSIRSLGEEQLIQIQNYGNKLNPLIMFYMLISVIIPALSITFLTIISSMVGLPERTTTMLFISLFFFVSIIQVMFLGMIRSVRPSLM